MVTRTLGQGADSSAGPPLATMRVATWNAEWLSPENRRLPKAIAEMASWQADVLVLTEINLAALDQLPGHVAVGGTDWGYRRPGSRYKVLLHGSTPWRDVDSEGDTRLPPGRFVAATTTTAIGDVRVVGICIPWRDAHVRTGRRDRARWQDHLQYLEVLPDVLASESTKGPVVLAGDFNQSLDGAGATGDVRAAITRALGPLTMLTTGVSCGSRLLDHIGVTAGLTGHLARVVCLAHAEPKLSDHDASITDLTAVQRP